MAYGNTAFGAPGQQGLPSVYGYGYPTLSTDEALNQKQTWTDGLGRLIEVDEPSGTAGASTSGHGSVTISGVEQNVTVAPACSSIAAAIASNMPTTASAAPPPIMIPAGYRSA